MALPAFFREVEYLLALQGLAVVALAVFPLRPLRKLGLFIAGLLQLPLRNVLVFSSTPSKHELTIPLLAALGIAFFFIAVNDFTTMTGRNPLALAWEYAAAACQAVWAVGGSLLSAVFGSFVSAVQDSVYFDGAALPAMWNATTENATGASLIGAAATAPSATSPSFAEIAVAGPNAANDGTPVFYQRGEVAIKAVHDFVLSAIVAATFLALNALVSSENRTERLTDDLEEICAKAKRRGIDIDRLVAAEERCERALRSH
jgi:hypothetical protein